MVSSYTTVQERRVGYPPAGVSDLRQAQPGESEYPLLNDAFNKGINKSFQALRRYVPDWKSIYAVLLFLAEAAVAARGYLLWPSVAHSNDGKTDADWFMHLDG